MPRKESCTICGSAKDILRDKVWEREVSSIASLLNELSASRAVNENFRRAAEKQFIVKEVENAGLILEHKRSVEDNALLVRKIKELEHTRSKYRVEIDEILRVTSEQELVNKDTTERVESFNIVANDLEVQLKIQAKVLYHERMKAAIRMFRSMRIEVNEKLTAAAPPPPEHYALRQEPGQQQQRQQQRQQSEPPARTHLHGCSTICQLPLPNNGIFMGVPVDALEAALAHIAHLTDSVAATLNIPLPHVIAPFDSTECLIYPQYNQQTCYSLAPAVFIGGTESRLQLQRDFSWKTIGELRVAKQQQQQWPQQAAGASSRNDKFAANDDELYVINESFPEAVMLLQADIISLCLSAGMCASDLWPPQALLMNLYALHQHCRDVCLALEAAAGDGDVSITGSSCTLAPLLWPLEDDDTPEHYGEEGTSAHSDSKLDLCSSLPEHRLDTLRTGPFPTVLGSVLQHVSFIPTPSSSGSCNSSSNREVLNREDKSSFDTCEMQAAYNRMCIGSKIYSNSYDFASADLRTLHSLTDRYNGAWAEMLARNSHEHASSSIYDNDHHSLQPPPCPAPGAASSDHHSLQPPPCPAPGAASSEEAVKRDSSPDPAAPSKPSDFRFSLDEIFGPSASVSTGNVTPHGTDGTFGSRDVSQMGALLHTFLRNPSSYEPPLQVGAFYASGQKGDIDSIRAQQDKSQHSLHINRALGSAVVSSATCAQREEFYAQPNSSEVIAIESHDTEWDVVSLHETDALSTA